MSMNAVNSGPPESDNKPASAGGGGPPVHAGMDRRLTVLETRCDTVLPTLATKAGLVELRLDLERMFANLQIKLRDDMDMLRGDVNKLRVDVHADLMSMMKWGVGIAISVIFGVVGQGIYLGRQIADQNTSLSKQIADQHTNLNKQIADQNTNLSKQIADQNTSLSKQISDLSARLPPGAGPAASTPDRPPAARAASASRPHAGAMTAPR